MAADRRVKTDRLAFLGLVALVVVLTAVYTLLQKTDEFSWQYVTNTVLFSFLGIVNLLLILGLLVMLIRSLIKLLMERYRNILGSRFRTKLVFTYLGLCLVPSILLFTAAVSIIERSIEAWFSTPVETISEDARSVVDAYYEDHRKRDERFATDIAARLAPQLTAGTARADLLKAMEGALRDGHLDLVSVHLKGEEPLTVANPRMPVEDLKPIPEELVGKGTAGGTFSWQDSLGSGQLIRSGVPLYRQVPGGHAEVLGFVVAGSFVGKDTSATTSRIARGVDNYRQLQQQKGNIKRVYVFGFLLITLLILFSATWVGLYLARSITVPIQMLAEGTREVSTGNLDYQVDLQAGDELGILVESFNKMTRELKGSRQTVELSNRELQQRNVELEERRRYIETVLESIPTGVISLDGKGRVTTINRAARRMLRIESAPDVSNLYYHELLSRESFAEIASLISRLMGSPGAALTREFHVSIGGQPMSLSVSFSPLDLGGTTEVGLLIVAEDITSLIKAQKVAAWREVARRIAHEIKNPLTPIQLSAQRMLKKWREGAPDFGIVVEEGASTIVKEVKTLKTLVNEFSGFARMPAANPAPADLHEIIESALGLYQGTYQDVSFGRRYDHDLPAARLDREQMKRVFVNLIDNALEAMGRRGEIVIGTQYVSSLQVMRVEVADDGPGIPPEDKEKLFLPYFSTKRRGTGLGLAIVNRIISDHHGYIRVEDNRPRGTRFIIELPAA
ncbi:MAG TPA: ATP-binding protein [Candidatus Polarisedimenticolia bacterium]|nr:ATP-binding protein [Candidatus Polarisedimenticolia bacterium]